MRGAKLQAALVKRREAEQIRYQKSAAVERYYDHWGRITSRYESWTTPQYYQDAEDAHRKCENEKKKATALQAKRERLKQQLQLENEYLQKEVEKLSHPKPKSLSTEILEGVRARLHDAEESKKRMDLEANLYSKWRLGFDRDAVIMDSKTCHQAMAKLNWIDRQVALQMEDEKNRCENQERELKLHEEMRRREEVLLEKSRMREQEIKEVRSLQEMHMAELKLQEQEANELKHCEARMKTKQGEIVKELDQLRIQIDRRRDRVVAMGNLRRIKMLIRDRSEAVRNDVRYDLQLLQRISMDNPMGIAEKIEYLRRKFQLQYDLEVEHQKTIENMYESEAKHNLAKFEDKWNSEAIIREQELRCLLQDRLVDCEAKLIDYNKRQRELIQIREHHIKAIEGANHRLKEMMSEKSRDEYVTSSHGTALRDTLLQQNGYNDEANASSRDLLDKQGSQRSRTFSNIFPFDDNFKELNLTNNRLTSEPKGVAQKGTDKLALPRFGRKKVAWS